MDNVLITGGAGFIGSSLTEKLLEKGSKVIVLDNFNDFYEHSIKEKNISEVFDHIREKGISSECLKVYKGDIRNSELLCELFQGNEIDLVVHLAAMAGVRQSIDNPGLYCDVNVRGTQNVLEECRKAGIKKLVFGSSSSVYGNTKKVPFNENDTVDHPISPYAASKKAGELLCYTYHHLYGMVIACLRFFTVYGPRQRPDLAIHKFARLILKDECLPFYGDGTTARDYTYIDDAVDGVIKTISWLKKSKSVYEIFNIGESRTVTLNEMIKALEKVLGKKALLHKMPFQSGDMRITCADISKAKDMLGYLPEKDFRDGVEDFAHWLKSKNREY